MIQIRPITKDITLGTLDLNTFALQQGIELKRDQEKAGARFLIEKLLGPGPFNLHYTHQKKPYLEGRSEHISISHSHDKLVVILNRSQNTGVDIELIRDKVITIKDKFLNPDEALFAGQDVEKLITIWSAKETMYKFYGLGQLDFKVNISVRDFDGSVIFGKIETEGFMKEFHLIRERIDNYILVYILSEI